MFAIFYNEALSVSLRLPPPPRGEAFCTVKSVENASCATFKALPLGELSAKLTERACKRREKVTFSPTSVGAIHESPVRTAFADIWRRTKIINVSS